MTRAALVLCVLMAAPCAHALEVVMHGASYHSRPGYNNHNPGFGLITAEGWAAGVYLNSYRRPSAYVGRIVETTVGPARVGVMGALATGYTVPAFGALSLAVPIDGCTVRLLVAPKVGRNGSTTAHIMVGVPW